MNTIYTVGYSGWTPQQLHRVVTERNATLVDIRLNPTSMQREWQQWPLRELFGTRYLHEGLLGNRNYKNGGPIELADPALALPTISHLLQRRSVVLMCGCRDVATCHRRNAAQFLSEQLGAPVEHLYPPVEVPAGAMKAITLTQPYAQLCALNEKLIETRSWATSYRGQLAIHAAKGLGPVKGKRGLYALCYTHPFRDVLEPAISTTRMIVDFPVPHYDPGVLPLGAVVATCDLVDCVRTEYLVSAGRVSSRLPDGTLGVWELTDQEEAFGDYAPKRYAWLLANIKPFAEPIPARGALSLWNWTLPAAVQQ